MTSSGRLEPDKGHDTCVSLSPLGLRCERNAKALVTGCHQRSCISVTPQRQKHSAVGAASHRLRGAPLLPRRLRPAAISVLSCLSSPSLCNLSTPSICTLTLIEPPLHSSCAHCVVSHGTPAGRDRATTNSCLTREFRVYSSLPSRQIDQDSLKATPGEQRRSLCTLTRTASPL